MYHFHLRLHSSSWHSPSYHSACPRIDYPNVLAAPVICFEMAVLVIPFIDVPVIVDPSGAPPPCHRGLRAHSFRGRDAREPIGRGNIGSRRSSHKARRHRTSLPL